MTETKKARIVYIKEHFLLLCNKDLVKALLLDRLVYYYQQNEQAYSLLEEEAQSGVKHTLDLSARGWVKKSAQFLTDSLLVGDSPRTVLRKLEELYHLGYIDRKRDAGQEYWYRPHMKQIVTNLRKLGYDLEGNPVGGEDEQKESPPQPVTPEKIQPNNELETLFDKTEEEKPTAAGRENLKKTSQWAAHYKTLDNAPEEIKAASKIIFDKTGFEPRREGRDKDWISSVTALWGACNKSTDILNKALEEGQKKRMDPQKPLTFSGPRSYISYAKDEVSKLNLRKMGHTPARIVIGATGNGQTNKKEKIKFGIQTLNV